MIRAVKHNFINYVYIGADLDTRKAFVVDPAWDLKAIQEYLTKEELSLEMILLTHSHVDHVNLVRDIVKEYNVPVYISSKEAQYYHYSCKNMMLFEDMEELWLGTKKIVCMETPGHSKGSTCFWFDEQYLFSGDTLFIEGCGICDTPGGSAYEMFHSFQKLNALIKDDTIVYPGHRFKQELGVRFEIIKNHNIYFAIPTKEQFASFRNRPNFKEALNFL